MIENCLSEFGQDDLTAKQSDYAVFHPGITGVLKHSWAWPVKQVISILDLTGDKVMRISDDGAAQITVNSGIAEYNYIMPAQQK
jgi:Cu2+-containing amine oxidase